MFLCLFGSEDSRTYISNEKRHTYVLLEGLASDMWELIIDNTESLQFKARTREKCVEDQVDGFLDELAQQELIVLLQDGVSKKRYLSRLITRRRVMLKWHLLRKCKRGFMKKSLCFLYFSN